MFKELAEEPWLHTWWSKLPGFMHQLSQMSEGNLGLKDYIACQWTCASATKQSFRSKPNTSQTRDMEIARKLGYVSRWPSLHVCHSLMDPSQFASAEGMTSILPYQ